MLISLLISDNPRQREDIDGIQFRTPTLLEDDMRARSIKNVQDDVVENLRDGHMARVQKRSGTIKVLCSIWACFVRPDELKADW